MRSAWKISWMRLGFPDYGERDRYDFNSVYVAHKASEACLKWETDHKDDHQDELISVEYIGEYRDESIAPQSPLKRAFSRNS